MTMAHQPKDDNAGGQDAEALKYLTDPAFWQSIFDSKKRIRSHKKHIAKEREWLDAQLSKVSMFFIEEEENDI